jgi:hypothetical protein
MNQRMFVLICILSCALAVTMTPMLQAQQVTKAEKPKEVAAQTTFKMAEYTPEARWQRSAYLAMVTQVVRIKSLLDKGMTPEEIGLADYKTYGPPHGWTTTNTPWRLWTTMWNNYTHPNDMCKVLEASETLVKVRCTRPDLPFMKATGTPVYGVTLDQWEKAGLTFNQALAAYHGMEFTQESDLDNKIITIRKK